MALRAVGADMRDNGERDILGRNAGGGPTIDDDAHPLRFFLPKGLCHEHVRDFRRADPKGIGAERAVRGRVAIAANDQQAGQRQSLFGTNHMHDALTWVAQAEQRDTILCRIVLKIADHRGDFRIGNALSAAAGRHVVISYGKRELRLGYSASARLHLAEAVERTLVHVMPIDPEQSRAIFPPRDFVRRP